MRAAALHFGLAILFLAYLWLEAPVGMTQSVASDLVDSSSEQRTQVSELIEQLGSDSYATRLRARDRLQHMGLEAFDELQAAQNHVDSEISLSARFLVSSLMVSWSKETDPPEVREVLFEYGAHNADDRSARIDMLAEFPDRKGLAALARLTRFEISLALSQRAAIALMQQPVSTDEATRKRHAVEILMVLDRTKRRAADWLRLYAADLTTGDYAAEDWQELINQQRDDIDSSKGEETTRPAVLELLRVCAIRANNLGYTEEALRLASNNMDLISPTTREMIDACTWAIDNHLHPFVMRLRGAHRRLFDQHPILLYGAAEATLVSGDETEANRLASQAIAIRPLPTDDAAKAKMQPRDIEEIARAHREIAKTLEERGLYEWAENEFRIIVEALDLDSSPAVSARTDLATMLGELQRHDDVVELLNPLAERVKSDAKLQQQMNLMFLRATEIPATLDYHKALALIQDGKEDEAKPLLMRSFEAYPGNVDVLISMYRLAGDDQWTQSVMAVLERTIRLVDARVHSAKNRARQFGRDGDTTLAQLYNEYAWLVSNTEGDYGLALDYSLKSLEISLDFAKLDTCARCYFATGDIDNAIKTQKKALKLMPHSPPLQRQLAEFVRAKEMMDESKERSQ